MLVKLYWLVVKSWPQDHFCDYAIWLVKQLPNHKSFPVADKARKPSKMQREATHLVNCCCNPWCVRVISREETQFSSWTLGNTELSFFDFKKTKDITETQFFEKKKIIKTDNIYWTRAIRNRFMQLRKNTKLK